MTVFRMPLMAECVRDPRAEDLGPCSGCLGLDHCGIDGGDPGRVFPMVFAIHPDTPGAVMSNDVELGCHQLISTDHRFGSGDTSIRSRSAK
jgi:hypothetical protein